MLTFWGIFLTELLMSGWFSGLSASTKAVIIMLLAYAVLWVISQVRSYNSK